MSHKHHLEEQPCETPFPPEKEEERDMVEEALKAAAPEEETAENPGAAPAPEIPETERLKAEVAEWQAKYLYLQAEYQNFRKRSARDMNDLRLHTVEDTLLPFLAVADYLGMAENAAETSDNLEAIRQGIRMIIGEFSKALDELGVKRMKNIGEKFDPALHDAMGREPSDTIPEGVILKEWAGGYQLGEKLLRPARVIVSSGKAAPAEVPAEESKTE